MQSSKLTKITWGQARKQAHTVNPELATIIDEINPDDSYAMYLGEYPFGNYIVNKGRFLVPNYSGKFVPVSETDNKEIQADLSYNEGSNPACLLLENSIEVFLDLDEEVRPFSYTPRAGAIFSTWKVTNPESCMQAAFLWDITSGARSLIMLPKITDKVAHQRLKNEFNFQTDPPKRLVDHWQIFKAIYQGGNAQWHSKILYFSKRWFDKLNDPAWFKFKFYLLEQSWKSSEYLRNKLFFNLVFSVLQKKYKLNYSPYINETVKNIFGIGMGCIHGLSPATNDTSAPISYIKKAYEDVYRIKNYEATIMEPAILTSQEDSVFYSLNYPIAVELGPKSRNRSRSLDELVHIKSLAINYKKAMQTEELNIYNSPLYITAKNIKLDFFHGSNDIHGIMAPTQIRKNHSYFKSVNKYQFAYSSIFFQGCIQIKK